MNKKIQKKIALLCVLAMVSTMFSVTLPPFCKTAKAIVGVFTYKGVTYERSLANNLFYAISFDSTEAHPTLEIPPSIRNSSKGEQYVIGGIKENLFQNYSFQSVTIGTTGVYTIGANAFKNASTIGDFTLTGGVSKVSASAFQNFSCGGSFKMSGMIDIAEESAFEGIQSNSLSIGKMRIIGKRVFANSCLKNVSFSSEVQRIGSQAYAGCDNLQTITLPSSCDYLEEVATDAFPNNKGMVVIIPAGCTSITSYHFENYNNFTFELDSSFTTEDSVYKQLESIGANIQFAEPTATPTITPTATPAPTVTPTATPTASPEVTEVPVPTATPGGTETPMPTVTPTVTPTVIPTATPTASPSATPEVTAVPVPTATPGGTETPMPTVTPTVTPTAIPTATPTATPVVTVTPTASPSATPEVTEAPVPTAASDPEATPSSTKPLKTGDTFVWKGLSYQVLNQKQVACTGAVSRQKKVLVIPGTVKINGRTFSVTKISKKAFYNMPKLNIVKLGNQIRVIGKRAFEKCKKLKKVILGKSLATIESRAFYLDTNLKVLDFSGKKLQKVGRRAFSKGKTKKTVLVPKGGNKKKYYRLLQKSIV
ncbi:MAG: leucine-rich repeat protein [Clostridiales bacterium]|nr:leucine-rich repeat protein [Clostridiales bacterium]